MRQSAANYLVFLSVATGAGCSSENHELISIGGTVTYQGVVVPGGTLLLQPPTGRAIVATIDEQGDYQTSVPVGSYRVGIVSSRGIPKEINPWQPNAELPLPLVPEKYGRPETSKTVVTVSRENTTIDILLQ